MFTLVGVLEARRTHVEPVIVMVVRVMRMVMADSAAPRQKKAGRSATFVEVQLTAASPTPREPATSGQTVVELVGTGGARMRIDVTGTSTVDVVGLAQAFWSSEP